MKVSLKIAVIFIAVYTTGPVTSRHLKHKTSRDGYTRSCVSKFYNRELGPLEILLLPLGEKLWLHAWLGNHMTNLLHMEGVDLGEVTQLAADNSRSKRSLVDEDTSEEDVPYEFPKYTIPNCYRLMLQSLLYSSIDQGSMQINVTCVEKTDKFVLQAHKDIHISHTGSGMMRISDIKMIFEDLSL